VRLKFEKRSEPSRFMVYATPVGAVVLTMIVGAIVFSLIGYNGPGAVYQVFIAPLTLSYKWGDIAVKASPLILIGVGLAVGNRAAIWNIGAEGQYVVGALAGTGIGLLTQNATGIWILPLMLVAGIIGGAVWGAVPAWLRTQFNVNETLSSLMLTYVAIHLMNYLVTGPWKDPSGFSFPQTPLVTADQSLPIIVPGTEVHLGVAITLLIAVVMWLLMTRSVFGFQIRVVGNSSGDFFNFTFGFMRRSFDFVCNAAFHISRQFTPRKMAEHRNVPRAEYQANHAQRQNCIGRATSFLGLLVAF